MNPSPRTGLKDLLGRAQHRLVPVVALLLIGLVYWMGVYSERTGFVRQVLDPGLKRIAQPVLNVFRSRPPELPAITLKVLEADLDTLLAVWSAALREGGAVLADAPKVACTVGDGLPGELMLWDTEPAAPSENHPALAVLFPATVASGSFRLVPATSEGVFGTWLLHTALEDHGLPAPRTDLVQLEVNGRNLGVHLRIEEPDSTMLARCGRTSGPVIRFDPGPMRRARAELALRKLASATPVQGEWQGAPVLITGRPTSASMGGTNSRTIRLLEGFRSGALPAGEVFDIRAMAFLLAACDLFGAHDAAEWWSLAFAPDAGSGKLLPVPLHGRSLEPIPALLAMRAHGEASGPGAASAFVQRLLADPTMHTAYIAALDSMVSDGWLEDFLQRHHDIAGRMRYYTHTAQPGSLDPQDILDHDRTVIRQSLRPRDLVLAYALEGPGMRNRIAVANVHSLPVRVGGLLHGTDTLHMPVAVVLPPRTSGNPLTYRMLTAVLPDSLRHPLVLLATTDGLPDERTVPVRTRSLLLAN